MSQLPSHDLFRKSADETLSTLKTSQNGLSHQEAVKRQAEHGLNIIHKHQSNALLILIRQITSNPLIIILAVATTLSYFLGQRISSYYIFGLIILSIVLGFYNEYAAEKTVESLLKKIAPSALLIRDGEKVEVPVSHITIGDIVLISQGSIVPADLRLISVNGLEMNESSLTGESKSVFKSAESTKEQNATCAFMGTSVVSGNATGVVVKIGKDTEFGKIAQSASYVIPVTDFEKGLSDFGKLIIKTILILTILICVVNTILGHNILNSVLFSLAIAVGMTPELLPVLVTISLAHGAGRLAQKKVVSKRLISIENLGNMDVLCTDKTGTLTEGNIHVVEVKNAAHEESTDVMKYAMIANDAIVHHKILGNPIDVAIWQYARDHRIAAPKAKMVFDTPFDFEKKSMYSVVSENKETVLIMKGAPETILSFCKKSRNVEHLEKEFHSLNENGVRVIALAKKVVDSKDTYTWNDAEKAEYIGYISFRDIPKTSAKAAIDKLSRLSVTTKVITGDNELVTKTICDELGLAVEHILTGPEIANMTEAELIKKVNITNIFARVTPEQKLAIIQALKKNGHTVGYLGDGINDVPSLRNADVGISVNSAVDVAKDAASIVLLRKGLDVIVDGIVEGRKTFNNTIKYILMSTSSNFGNMFSAAGASFLLPFLPMTPVQILLTNGLYDISQLSIPTDNVDAESLVKPRHWNIGFIKNYMIFFGPLSSLYDFLTFGVMIFVFHAKSPLFQTGWFIESLATEILVVFVIRTSRTPFFLSKPSIYLFLTCLAIVAVGIILPFTPLARSLGFIAPPPLYFAFLVVLVTTYLGLIEVSKMFFLKRFTL